MKNVYVLLLLICFIVVSHLQRDFNTNVVEVVTTYIEKESNLVSITTTNAFVPFSLDLVSFNFFR